MDTAKQFFFKHNSRPGHFSLRGGVMNTYPTLDFGLGETTNLLRNTLRDFVAKEIRPMAETIDREDTIPHSIWRNIGELGLLGITASQDYGGAQMGHLEHVIAMEELRRGSAALGLSYGAHSNLCVNQISLNGSIEQKQQFLPDLITGKKIGALAMSEAEAGSDVISMRLQAKKKGDTFLLNGAKMWITNGPIADIIIVYAKTAPEKGSKGITAFLVESDMDGFSRGPKLDKLGMRGSPTCELFFKDCPVPKKNILGEINRGVQVLMSGLDYERLILAGGPLGIMANSMDVILPYIHQRRQFKKAIGEFQLMQGKLADIYTTWSASRSYAYAVAKAADGGHGIRKDAAGVLLYTAEKATWMASQAIQCLGGNGYINEFPAGRLLRDAKLYEIGAGTSEIRRMLIGRELFKETSF